MAFHRVLIADDSLAFVDSAKRFLTLEPAIVIVGHAGSASVVLERIAELRPDVLLLSVNLPGAGGLEFVPRIKALAHAPSVIVLALDDLEDYRTAAINAGADGFVAKTKFVIQLAPAIAAIDVKALACMKIHD